jgi:hypothetical protein
VAFRPAADHYCPADFKSKSNVLLLDETLAVSFDAL